MKNILVLTITLMGLQAFASGSDVETLASTKGLVPPVVEESIPAVSNLSITQLLDCGATPSPGQPLPLCPPVAVINFRAVTIGSCDSFYAKTEQEDVGVIRLTIIKATVIRCTRPEFPPHEKDMQVQVEEDLTKEQVQLLNPMIVNIK